MCDLLFKYQCIQDPSLYVIYQCSLSAMNTVYLICRVTFVKCYLLIRPDNENLLLQWPLAQSLPCHALGWISFVSNERRPASYISIWQKTDWNVRHDKWLKWETESESAFLRIANWWHCSSWADTSMTMQGIGKGLHKAATARLEVWVSLADFPAVFLHISNIDICHVNWQIQI